jgi:hypothetical protein
MPSSFPPLKTLDAWPGYRADMVAVPLISVGLLAVVGALLPLAVSSFPRWIGLGAVGLAALLVVSSAVARPARRALVSAFSDFPANQPGPSKRQLFDDLIAQYRQGKLTLVQTLTPFELSRLANIPKGEELTAPSDQFIELGFNQRDISASPPIVFSGQLQLSQL